LADDVLLLRQDIQPVSTVSFFHYFESFCSANEVLYLS
jgi:hypothetical protein